MESHSVACYPQPGKRKAIDLCEAFAAGVRACGGSATVYTQIPEQLAPGDAVFYGVRPAWAHLWEQAKAEKRDWYFIDNSYFDCVREKQFRVTLNAMQADGLNACWEGRDTEEWKHRWKALGIQIRPWQSDSRFPVPDSRHVVVCPQSDEFMQVCAGWKGNWLEQALAVLKRHTSRKIVVREWSPKKLERSRTLAADLEGAHALVTHGSAAAIEALLAGVPVFCTGRGPGRWYGRSDLESIETPEYPEPREGLMKLLANNQWTLAEFADGTAWKALQAAVNRWAKFLATGAYA